MQALLNNLSTTFISGTFIIKADIDKTNPLSSHLLAIDVFCEIDGEKQQITTLNPWHCKIEFRHRGANPNNRYCLTGKITNNETIVLTDWFRMC